MSEIFVLMWIADAVGSVGTVAVILFTFAAIGMGFILANDLVEGDGLDTTKGCFRKLRWPFVVLLVIALMPSDKTIRAYAAIRVGEYAVATPLGEKAVKTLETILDRIIEDKKGKS